MPYYGKSNCQSYVFLAAFNRTSSVCLPKRKPGVIDFTFGNKFDLLSNPRGAYKALSELVTAQDNFATMLELAEKLVSDDSIESIYPQHFLEKGKLNPNGNMAKLFSVFDDPSKSYNQKLMEAVSGLDWVGDELGFPYLLYAHSAIVKKIVSVQLCFNGSRNKNFGVRIHAGEGVLRKSTIFSEESPVIKAFAMHMLILTAGIKRLYTLWDHELGMDLESCGEQDIKPRIRIGHGVAFVHGINWQQLSQLTTTESALASHLDDFRAFLKDKNIPCELNPTSNHLLLSDSFGQSVVNRNTLKIYLDAGLPVVLSTDDDGIWAIRKCKEHHRHIRVAFEFCQAVVKKCDGYGTT